MPPSLKQRVNEICEMWEGYRGGDEVSFPKKDKIIQDPIHGAIEVEKELVFLIDSVMMQRLRRISQLGLTSQVFPGANHTRFEHSLGVMHLVGRILDRLKARESLSETQVFEAKAAGLLHDIGHLPFSHSPEPLLEIDKDVKSTANAMRLKPSELMSFEIITSGWMKRLFDIINEKSTKFEPNVLNVANQAVGLPPLDDTRLNFLGELIHANFDADRMDYLMRDAHYTGVPLGTLDVERLIQCARVSIGYGGNKQLAVDIKGLHSLESMIVARSVMYSAVYYHHGVRAANDMLTRAIYMTSGNDPLSLLKHDDWSLFDLLCHQTGPAENMMNKLRTRNIFKAALTLKTKSAQNRSALGDFLEGLSFQSTIEQEDEINRMVADDGGKYAIIDFPKLEVYTEIEQDISENGDVNPIRQFSRIAKGVEDDSDLKWRGYVFALPSKLPKVRTDSTAYLENLGLKFH